MNVLGIETSCDETAAAVVRNGCEVLSSVVSSQVELHRPYGGVVPEIASRNHVEVLPGVIEEAIARSGVGWGQLDEIAVTYGPGLASSLLVGLAAAKGLAARLDKPLVAVNHLEAHVYSVFLGEGAPQPPEIIPCVALIVSGGHTCLVRVMAPGMYRLLGQTTDDAAGEAFDKGANLLGLGYPGGPAIDEAAGDGDAHFVRFPRGQQRRDKNPIHGLRAELCFSFSGVKTALLYYLRRHPLSASREELPSVAASYQEAIVDALVQRCRKTSEPGECLIVCGGVSLNRRLRDSLAEMARDQRVRLLVAEPRYCADNAAMIAGLAGSGGGLRGPEAATVDAAPGLEIGANQTSSKRI